MSPKKRAAFVDVKAVDVSFCNRTCSALAFHQLERCFVEGVMDCSLCLRVSNQETTICRALKKRTRIDGRPWKQADSTWLNQHEHIYVIDTHIDVIHSVYAQWISWVLAPHLVCKCFGRVASHDYSTPRMGKFTRLDFLFHHFNALRQMIQLRTPCNGG